MASSRKGAPDLPGRVAACLARSFPAGGRLTVGYSGGLDSSVLLHVLAGLRASAGFSLSALHVHHGLSPHADAWAAHCQRICAGLGVPLTVRRVSVEPLAEGLEAAARAARYAVFSRLDADAVALAHHRDDQAETVLLQLLRGGGVKGLAAMPASRRLAGGKIALLRPLLDRPRAELEAWARAHALEWVEDESNRLTHLARNAVRHEILPLIESRFPGAGAALGRAAAQFAEAAALLDALADLDGLAARSPEGLAVDRLAALPEPRARNLLRRYLEAAGARLGQDKLREGLRQLLRAGPDARVEQSFGEVSLRRFRGRAIAVPQAGEDAEATAKDAPILTWHGEAVLDLGAAGRLRFRAAEGEGVRLAPGAVEVSFRRGGERLRPHPRRPRRLLKDLLREAGIPPWRRDRLPLLFVDGRLAWAAGLGADADFLAGPGEAGWLLAWEPGAC
jgi:tRNA(Ile)-lysidine synthase